MRLKLHPRPIDAMRCARQDVNCKAWRTTRMPTSMGLVLIGSNFPSVNGLMTLLLSKVALFTYALRLKDEPMAEGIRREDNDPA